ncbi:MAG TPA: beta-ketoacyl-ACP synthase III [Acidobacteriota bacterium]|nr:beta-ketoacyl-ACP synthase III [Acidobacteriota bacterium]
MYNAKITAVAYHAPEKIVTNKDLEKILDTSDEWIRTRTGILERHIVAKGEAVSDLAATATRKLLAQRGIPAKEIACIIIATVTPDMLFPSTACLLQEKVGAVGAWGFDLSGACAGFVFALATASTFVHTRAYKKVLVVGADVMTSILNPKDRNTYVLFGDAAGAVLVEPAESGEEGIIDFLLRCDGSGAKFLYMPGGGSLHPATHETVKRGMHYVHQDGRGVFKAAVQGMSDISAEILERNNISVSDVDLYVPHQANRRIIEAAVERMGLDDSKVVLNIDRFANTTAATIPIGLAEAYESKRVRAGDLVLMATFGAGFTWGSLLLRWLI